MEWVFLGETREVKYERVFLGWGLIGFQHDFGEFEKWNRALRSRALPLRCLRRGCSLVTVSPEAMEPGESVLLTSVPASGRGENISVCYGFPAYLETRGGAGDL